MSTVSEVDMDRTLAEVPAAIAVFDVFRLDDDGVVACDGAGGTFSLAVAATAVLRLDDDVVVAFNGAAGTVSLAMPFRKDLFGDSGS